MSFTQAVSDLERKHKIVRDDIDYVIRWLIQTDAPTNIIMLQARALKQFGWPTHGRHCSCSACAREDWTNYGLTPCGMHGKECPARYQPYVR